MAHSLNKAVLIGNVGAQPEVRTTRMGTRVATFSVATERRVRGSDPRTDWHRVIAWEPLVRYVERALGRGDRVYVEGRLEYRPRTSRPAGDPIAEIIADELILVESRHDRAQPSQSGKEKFIT